MIKRLHLASIVAFFLSIIPGSDIFGQPPSGWQSKVSPALSGKLSSNAKTSFIVVLKGQADLSSARDIHGKEAKGNYVFETLRSFAENSQQDILKMLISAHVAYHSFWIVNAICMEGDASLVEKLTSRTDVLKIISNASFTSEKSIAPAVSYNRDETIPWGIDSIHAPAVWAMGYTGQGTVIGGEDTGYDWEHPAIKNQYRGWNGAAADHNYNWHDAVHTIDFHNYGYGLNPCGIDILQPCDDYGHGTHTMGTMVGKDGDLEIGVAPGSKWIGERNMERGWGNLSSYIEALQWFIAPTDLANENPDPSKAPHVINNSWVCPAEEGCDASNFSLLEDAVNNVKAAGIVVVASAGNDGPACNTVMFPPAMFEGSFSVGAVDSTMNAAWFSSRGTVTAYGPGIMKPNVTAPGVDVLSCVPGNQYTFYSGTSMAGPHAAGTVALIISANPLLAGEVDQIETIIEETAHPVTSSDGCGADQNTSIPNNTYGYGIIDAYAAVQQALLATSATITAGDQIVVFPSLTSDVLHIKLPATAGTTSFQLYSVVGNYTGAVPISTSNAIIHLSDLPEGMYIYRLVVNGKNFFGKVMKQ